MTLREATDAYVAWRRAHGAKFVSSAWVLHQFCRHAGDGIDCGDVGRADVLGFLAGKGPLTRNRANRHSALAGFYRYAVSRGLVGHSPLPAAEDEPRQPQSAPPHVYTREELQRLFGAAGSGRQGAVQLDADTLKMTLLLLYGAGLRFGEALRLTFDDVDLDDAMLTVRDGKFFKSRLVPVDPRLAEALRNHARRRRDRPLPNGSASAFLANRNGAPLARTTVGNAFRRALKAAGIRQDRDGGRRPPNLHGLRHAAAVHRLEDWHRNGVDVQLLLPALSTWLGHASLDGTSVYLTMTPELLHQASARFERHFLEGQRQ